jgi:small subunit ribosomal protein S20
MANTKSAEKRIRQIAKRRLLNRYKKTTMRTYVKRLRAMSSKEEAIKMLPLVVSTIDKVAKSHVIHKNTAAHMKSKLTRFVNGLA